MFSNVEDVRFMQAAKVEGEVLQLFILRVIKEWKDRDAVVEVQAEAETRVVYYDHVPQVPIGNDPEILDLSIWRRDAMVSVQSFIKYLVSRVQIVKHCISICSLGCCEGYDLELLAEDVQALSQVWSDVNLDRSYLPADFRDIESHFSFHSWWVSFIKCMNHRLIKVEDEYFFMLRCPQVDCRDVEILVSILLNHR